jgi:uncharacterized glyoxalase superfamily protein PhnB
MKSNASMPSSFIIPQLPYTSVTEAAAWLERAFGFTVRLTVGDHRIQMNAAGGHVVLTKAEDAPPKCSLMVRVEDVYAHHARVIAAGASENVSVAPQNHPYGERQYTVIDCGGHAWTFSQSLDNVAPASWGGTSGKL